MSGQSGGRLKLAKLNEQLTCKLCQGYFIDATTIIECLHSFCRSCIVKYLETNKYCPICEVQVHKSKPLLNIRPDHTLQDIVYKLVPGCYQNEMRCRREFYEKHPEAPLSSMSPEARGEPIESHIYSPDESLSLSLEYYNPSLNDSPIPSETDEEKSSSSSSKSQPRRYLRCPAAVTVFHLQKLIRAKYGLSDVHRVDIMYKEEPLYGNYTLMDVMYIYHWRRKVPLHLSYRIFESSPKRLKLSEDNDNFKASLSTAGITLSNAPEDTPVKREWKEVQLKISETGVMSVITSPESKKSQKKETIEEDQRRLDESVAGVVKPKKKTEDPKEPDKGDKSDRAEKPEKQDKPEKQKKSMEKEEDNNNKEKTPSSSVPESSSASKASEAQAKPKTDQKPTTAGSNSQTSGSKIESLSAKLQFQPKVGPINHTYSKKSQKEKKSVLEKVLKKSEVKSEKEQKKSVVPAAITPKTSSLSSSTSSTPSSSKVSTTSTTSTHISLSTFGGCTYSTAPSLSISLTSRRNSSPDRTKDDNQKPNNQSSEPLNVPAIPQSTFPFYMQNFVDGNLKSPTKSSSASPKCPATQTYSLQTPSISMYSIPTSSAKHQNTSTPTTSSPRSTVKGLEITSVYSSVPPCPDAIPISLMHSSKPTIRKTEILAKGTNVNEICAKISENSREKDKNKTETRTRSEIPDLLKIPIKSSSDISKHGTIPNVPSYTPSNSLTISPSDSKSSSSKAIPNLSSSSPLLLHTSSKVSNPSKKQSTGFKTLRDPPRPWNPSLSRNNYVAAKNQAKELASEQSNPSTPSGKSLPSKSRSIFKHRNNLPRYLGNPASGVKPLYGVNNDPKEKESTSKSPSLITKIEPKTLSPISTTNSPIVSPPPYSPNARNYNAPFTRDIGRTSSSLSPRNSPVNMLTNPFIPNATPNTNPRIFPQGFLPPFSDGSRFGGPLMRSPMSISSAYHNLPASINRCIPRSYSALSYQGLQAPAVQRNPPSSHSSPKSPKISTGHVTKDDESKAEGNAFNLSKSGAGGASGTAGVSDLSKHNEEKVVGKERERRKSGEKVDEEKAEGEVKKELKKDLKKELKRDLKGEEEQSSSKTREDNKEEKKEKEEERVSKETVGLVDSSGASENKLNGVNPEASGSSVAGDKDEEGDKQERVKESKVSEVKEEKEEVIVKENKCEELSKEIKAQEQRSKPES
ncbi:polycomb group protein Psc-like [Diachasmimorpha longicaudata]|uniref:polycomb group protein Psc-like n=1 Tax=Diachasmimorpha longicaudata TaxID=58733 RepID=UPI0030B90FF9